MNGFPPGERMRKVAERTAPSADEIIAHFQGRPPKLVPRPFQRALPAGGVLLAAAALSLLLWQLGSSKGPGDLPPIAASLEQDLRLHARRPRTPVAPSGSAVLRDSSSEEAAIEPGLGDQLAQKSPSQLPRKSAVMASASPQDQAARSIATDVPTAPSAAETGQHAEPRAGAPTASQSASQSAESKASWTMVAEALRSQDDAALDAALGPLLASGEAAERDAALLVRLRVALRKGYLGAQQKTELERLARAGSTASIRNSARKMLEDATRPGHEEQSGAPNPSSTGTQVVGEDP